jgi:hypothetical protein
VDPERVGENRDQVIEAGERDQLDELRLAPVRAQGRPPRVVHLGAVLECVGQSKEQSLGSRRLVRPGGGRQLGRREADAEPQRAQVMVRTRSLSIR